MDRDPMVEALVDGFIAESREICHRITAHILALEHPDEHDESALRKQYEELARGLHTLKGNSDTFGFPQLAKLTHDMEDVVAAFRRNLAPLPGHIADLLLRANDVFMAKLAARSRPDDEKDLGALIELGDKLIRAAREAPAVPATKTAPTAEPAILDEPIPEALAEWRVGASHVEALLLEIERLRQLRLRLDEQRDEVNALLASVQRGRPLDASELGVTLTMLSRGLSLDGDETADVVDSLETELKNIATLPMRWVLDPLQRAVRDLCRTLGKEARLSCVGAEISIDRRVLEALKGPLVHLVRNAVDHGIEPPAARIKAGKHREGAITIRVERTGNTVFIEIEDDGGGIDTEAIRREAVARGMLSAEEAAAASDRDLHQLVFRPGFSTRGAVGDVSGRGVGLDVVRAALRSQSGHIELTTKLGSGTRFVLAVPASLGSTPILVVRAGEQMFGVPMFAIELIRAATAQEAMTSRTTTRIEHRGQLLELVDLAALLGVRAAAPITAGRALVIVHSRGRRVALEVDELVGDHDLVVRPLPAELLSLPAYQGATTQARGDLLLVLQPEFLVDNRAIVPTDFATTRRALVVDDSLTARALHRTILESGGFQVHTASGARQALDHLRYATYDVVIADVMMNEIDGIQMTATLRSRPETRLLPIVLVSANDTLTQRERGMSAGADVFLSKKDCISGRLLAEVAAVIARRERA